MSFIMINEVPGVPLTVPRLCLLELCRRRRLRFRLRLRLLRLRKFFLFALPEETHLHTDEVSVTW